MTLSKLTDAAPQLGHLSTPVLILLPQNSHFIRDLLGLAVWTKMSTPLSYQYPCMGVTRLIWRFLP